MAVKKISQLDTKSFLGTSGAAENSYVMINYAESANATPVTYKATIEELGKAIANDLQLLTVVQSTPVSFEVSQGAYTYTQPRLIIQDSQESAPEGAMYIFDDDGLLKVGASQSSGGLLSNEIITTGYVDMYGSQTPLVVYDNGLQYVDAQGIVTNLVIDNTNLPNGVLSTAGASDPTIAEYKNINDSTVQIFIAPYASGFIPVAVGASSGELCYYDINNNEYKPISLLLNQ